MHVVQTPSHEESVRLGQGSHANSIKNSSGETNTRGVSGQQDRCQTRYRTSHNNHLHPKVPGSDQTQHANHCQPRAEPDKNSESTTTPTTDQHHPLQTPPLTPRPTLRVRHCASAAIQSLFSRSFGANDPNSASARPLILRGNSTNIEESNCIPITIRSRLTPKLISHGQDLDVCSLGGR